MKFLLVSCLLLISIVAQNQVITDSILIEQHFRIFSYNQPTGNIKDGSLLFVLHGSGSNGKDMMKKNKKLESRSTEENLLIVYPDGYQRFWNECRKYSTAAANKENINEEAFFTAMIQYFHNRYGIDKNNIFAAGTSGGGHMAYKLGLTIPNQVKAIAAIIANMPDDDYCDCTPAGKSLPVLIINGTEDKTNPYNGGEMYVGGNSFGVVRSSENTLAYWASLAGYTGSPSMTILPDTDPSDKKTIEKYTYQQQNKPPVTLLKVIGGHHDYPNDIDVHEYSWEFFKSVK